MEGYTRAVEVGKILEGEVMSIRVAETTVAIARSGGSVYAFQDQCSHQECPLSDGYLDAGEIECACHGARFDLGSGAVTLPPAVDPIQIYPSMEIDGFLFVRLDASDDTSS